MLSIDLQISAVKESIRDLSLEVAKTTVPQVKVALNSQIEGLKAASTTLTLLMQQNEIQQQLQAAFGRNRNV
jgi:hypothetical protein